MAGAPPDLPLPLEELENGAVLAEEERDSASLAAVHNHVAAQPQSQSQGRPTAIYPSGNSSNPTPVGTPMSHSMTSSMSSSRGSLSPDGMDCYGNERQALHEQGRFYNNPMLSDVRLRVGERKVYHAHKLILVRSSDVFEKMLCSDWLDSSKKEVELIEEPECIRVFSHFLKYLYSCHITLNCDNTLPILVLADKYNVTGLREVAIQFACLYIIPKMQLKDVFHIWFQYATKCYHQSLIGACVAALAEKMDDVVSSEWEQEWLSLDKEQLLELIKSSDLILKHETQLWQAVVRWLQAPKFPKRQAGLEANLSYILPYIRFPMMTPDQLCQVEQSSLVQQFPSLFMPHIIQAYKYHSLSLASRSSIKEFNGVPFLLRNYTDLRWDKRLMIHNYSGFQRGAEVSMRFSTRASTFPAQMWEWELKVYPKGFSSTSEDFRCILYSNLILDQPRPVEFQLSVVDNQRTLSSVTGKKNFSKKRYTTDTEIDKKVTVADLCIPDSPLLVNDTLVLQILLRPVE